MPRDERAHLADIIDACDAITVAVHDLDLEAYETNRLVRSSVEREFIIIGEAIAALARNFPSAFGLITPARRIVDFRNQLTHAYRTVDNALVWAIIDHDVPLLRRESRSLTEGARHKDEDGQLAAAAVPYPRRPSSN